MNKWIKAALIVGAAVAVDVIARKAEQDALNVILAKAEQDLARGEELKKMLGISFSK